MFWYLSLLSSCLSCSNTHADCWRRAQWYSNLHCFSFLLSITHSIILIITHIIICIITYIVSTLFSLLCTVQVSWQLLYLLVQGFVPWWLKTRIWLGVVLVLSILSARLVYYICINLFLYIIIFIHFPHNPYSSFKMYYHNIIKTI